MRPGVTGVFGASSGQISLWPKVTQKVGPLTELFAELTGLPPVLVQVGDREIILDDSRVLVERVKQKGGVAVLQVWPNMIHVFQAYPSDLEPARQAIADIGAFLRRYWPGGTTA